MNFLKKIFGFEPTNASLSDSNLKPSQTTNPDVRKISLFIVDDNVSFLKLIQNHLINKEKDLSLNVTYNIKTFSNGEECISCIEENPDIIILDYFLNSENGSFMNGDEVFKKIMEINPQQKVVMLSGQDESTIVLSLIKMGLRDYIMKDDEMFEHLQRVLLEVYNSK